MKNKKIALYDPYLDTMGGGEKHVLSILEVLSKERGFTPYVFWDNQNEVTETLLKLNIRLDNLRIEKNIFPHSGFFQKYSALKEFDVFIYVTDGSYFFSSAKDSYVFCMVPNKNLFKKTFANTIKLFNWKFISNSEFTRENMFRWGVFSKVLYPYISEEYIVLKNQQLKKENIILVSGRFFEHLHSKRQDIAIEAFKLLQTDKKFSDYKLILAGSVLDSDKKYLDHIQNKAEGIKNIEFKINVPFNELFELYKKSKYYWHFTGYGVNDQKEPEKVEHLGITPLEAMASKCAVFCYNGGGPKEYIFHTENGYVFNTIEELCKLMSTVTDKHIETVTLHGADFVGKNFSYDVFKANVLRIFREV